MLYKDHRVMRGWIMSIKLGYEFNVSHNNKVESKDSIPKTDTTFILNISTIEILALSKWLYQRWLFIKKKYRRLFCIDSLANTYNIKGREDSLLQSDFGLLHI